MKSIFDKIEEKEISINEYHEENILCGYELNTYTAGGVNQIIFIDFRDTDKDPKNEDDFCTLFLERIQSIDIDEEIELNRQDERYRAAFTLSESLKDFQQWHNDLLELAHSPFAEEIDNLTNDNYRAVQQAKEFLTSQGYYTGNLWRVDDIKSNYDCTNEQAQDILDSALKNSATMEQIWFAIHMEAEELNLTKIVNKEA